MKAGCCKHYNGYVVNDRCDAGVSYKSVLEANKKLCCIAGKPSSCRLYEEPTKEEIEAFDRETEQMFEAAMNKMAILEPVLEKIKAKYKGRDMVGRMNCPVCKTGQKSLTISHAGYNGHCSAICTTEDCVRFME